MFLWARKLMSDWFIASLTARVRCRPSHLSGVSGVSGFVEFSQLSLCPEPILKIVARITSSLQVEFIGANFGCFRSRIAPAGRGNGVLNLIVFHFVISVFPALELVGLWEACAEEVIVRHLGAESYGVLPAAGHVLPRLSESGVAATLRKLMEILTDCDLPHSLDSGILGFQAPGGRFGLPPEPFHGLWKGRTLPFPASN
jgi:hypothetical protein